MEGRDCGVLFLLILPSHPQDDPLTPMTVTLLRAPSSAFTLSLIPWYFSRSQDYLGRGTLNE
jgi:hypothetical protein